MKSKMPRLIVFSTRDIATLQNCKTPYLSGCLQTSHRCRSAWPAVGRPERGLPLVAQSAGAQVHASQLLVPIIEAIPAIRGPAGRDCKRPETLRTVPADHEHTPPGCAGEALWMHRGVWRRVTNCLAAGVDRRANPWVVPDIVA